MYNILNIGDRLYMYMVNIFFHVTFNTHNRNKECPTCRKKLISKRSLRPDPNFDALIAKVRDFFGD